MIKGKYQVESRIGGGGMAEVFVASAVGAEGVVRKVAIKRILPGYSSNPSFAQMFVAEARITSQLSHPNIVGLLDFDRDEAGNFFIVMELVQGCDLTRLGPLSFPAVAFVISELLRGLGHAHAARVIHRDVSPHNVLVSRDGAVKLSDFGIAKVRAQTTATASLFIKGKPAYMSPEQANNAPVDARSDLFAVGIMMWELLTGQRLFAADDIRASLAKIMFGTIERPRSLRAEIPKGLDKVVMRFLERDPAARYQDADAAIRDLAAFTAGGREALNAAVLARVAGQTVQMSAAATPIPRRRRRWLGVVIAAALSVIAAAVALQARGGASANDVASTRAAEPDAPRPRAKPDPRLMSIDLQRVMPACAEYVSELSELSGCSARSRVERSDYAKQLSILRSTLTTLTPGDFTGREQNCREQSRELILHLDVCTDGLAPEKLETASLDSECTSLLARISRLAGCSQHAVAEEFTAKLSDTKRRLVWMQAHHLRELDSCKRLIVELPDASALGCQ